MTKIGVRDTFIGFVLIAFLGVLVAAGEPVTTQVESWNDAWISAEEKRLDQIDHMVDSAVKILYRGGHGSGILFVRGDEVYVLTAAHVVEDRSRHASAAWRLLPKELQPVSKQTYGKGTIFIQRHRQDETTFADDVYTAEVIVADGPTDAAILRIKHATPENFPGLEGGVSFDLRNNKALRRGMKTIHVGNFNNSIEAVTEGVISNPQQPLEHGPPPFPDFRVIQVTNMIAPGSSGGGLYLTGNGKCIGIVVRTTWMPGDSLVIPVYQIDQWLNGISDELGLLLEQPE